MTHDFKREREKMVEEQLIPRGIVSTAVLDAMRSIPRHIFIPENLHNCAYSDAPIPIGSGQTILSSIWVKALSINREEDYELKDAEIIDLFWNRDQAAIAQTAKQYGNYCYAIANGILNNREDSEECLNDTWHRAWEAMPPQRPNKLTLFLGKITRHLAFDKYKMSRAKKRGGSEFAPMYSL